MYSKMIGSSLANIGEREVGGRGGEGGHWREGVGGVVEKEGKDEIGAKFPTF